VDVDLIRVYIDGLDSTGFLLADNGELARRSRPYTFNQYFASDAGDLQSQPGSPRGAQRVDPRVP